MRGGTSRGPFFLADWLPQDPAARDRTLIAALGSPHELQIDGLGGGNSLTSKVAIVSRSVHADCDVDYLFAQVSVDEARVDTRPNCGNMLAGVGPFAIEQGLVPASSHGNTTTVRVYNVNTRSRIDVQVCTAGGSVHYEGDVHIDGVQGTAAPVLMNFLDAWGAVTGQIFPTGQRIDTSTACRSPASMPHRSWCWCAPQTLACAATKAPQNWMPMPACWPGWKPFGAKRVCTWAWATYRTVCCRSP